jgi:hypothetical protein
MVDQQLAASYHLRPGSTFRLAVIPQDPATGNAEPGKAVVVSATVTAVVAFDDQIVAATSANAQPVVLLSPRFARTSLAASARYGTDLSIQLRPAASLPKFTAAAATLGLADPRMQAAGGVFVTDLTEQAAATQRAIRPQAVALGAFAALAELILLAVGSQLLSRQVVLDSRDFPVLRTLGMTPVSCLRCQWPGCPSSPRSAARWPSSWPSPPHP